MEEEYFNALIAEDDKVSAGNICGILNQIGLEHTLVVNGQLCFAEYKKNPNKYSIIFMDIIMPVLDGIEATKLIRSYEQNNLLPKKKIIAVTSNTDDQKILEAGVDEILEKPMTLNKMQPFLPKSKQITTKKTKSN